MFILGTDLKMKKCDTNVFLTFYSVFLFPEEGGHYVHSIFDIWSTPDLNFYLAKF